MNAEQCLVFVAGMRDAEGNTSRFQHHDSSFNAMTASAVHRQFEGPPLMSVENVYMDNPLLAGRPKKMNKMPKKSEYGADSSDAYSMASAPPPARA
eukprot:3062152-Pyramimonas_sp.AAC.2